MLLAARMKGDRPRRAHARREEAVCTRAGERHQPLDGDPLRIGMADQKGFTARGEEHTRSRRIDRPARRSDPLDRVEAEMAQENRAAHVPRIRQDEASRLMKGAKRSDGGGSDSWRELSRR